jgi:hypothetical protein
VYSRLTVETQARLTVHSIDRIGRAIAERKSKKGAFFATHRSIDMNCWMDGLLDGWIPFYRSMIQKEWFFGKESDTKLSDYPN